MALGLLFKGFGGKTFEWIAGGLIILTLVIFGFWIKHILTQLDATKKALTIAEENYQQEKAKNETLFRLRGMEDTLLSDFVAEKDDLTKAIVNDNTTFFQQYQAEISRYEEQRTSPPDDRQDESITGSTDPTVNEHIESNTNEKTTRPPSVAQSEIKRDESATQQHQPPVKRSKPQSTRHQQSVGSDNKTPVVNVDTDRIRVSIIAKRLFDNYQHATRAGALSTGPS